MNGGRQRTPTQHRRDPVALYRSEQRPVWTCPEKVETSLLEGGGFRRLT
jgi:hypothetical protein